MNARILGVLFALALVAGCGGAGANSPGAASSYVPARNSGGAFVAARFVEGAPVLAAKINGVVQDLGTVSLSVNGQTVVTQFDYGTLSQFLSIPAGTATLNVFNSVGYRLPPVTASGLAAGKNYSIVLVGSYPHYRAIAFEEPAAGTSAQLSIYEASPKKPALDFGTFTSASCSGSGSGYKKLGSAALGKIVTVSLGAKVKGVGGYVGKNVTAMTGGSITPCAANPFDARNVLPFENSPRLSLFVLDPAQASTVGPVIGVLDQ